QGYDRPRTEDFYRRLTERLNARPGVRAVGLAAQVALGLSNQQRGVTVPGYTPAPNENLNVDYNMISPGYLDAMGIRLLGGRDFSAQDDSSAPPVLIVNQRFADRFWHGQSPVGRTVHTGERDYTVVGLVPTGRYNRLGEDPLAYMYLVHAQTWSSAMNI